MDVLSWRLPTGTENFSLEADIMADIRNGQLLNTSKTWYNFSQVSWWMECDVGWRFNEWMLRKK
jgi:hypothetical protein